MADGGCMGAVGRRGCMGRPGDLTVLADEAVQGLAAGDPGCWARLVLTGEGQKGEKFTLVVADGTRINIDVQPPKGNQ